MTIYGVKHLIHSNKHSVYWLLVERKVYNTFKMTFHVNRMFLRRKLFSLYTEYSLKKVTKDCGSLFFGFNKNNQFSFFRNMDTNSHFAKGMLNHLLNQHLRFSLKFENIFQLSSELIRPYFLF